MFQVILCNKGDIDAVFSFLPSTSQFGAQFSFVPTQGIVTAGGYQAIQVRPLAPEVISIPFLLLIPMCNQSER